MPRESGTLLVHQCLHGYADGHELIESSAKLTPQADHVLLTMSDMSGPSMMNGYQSYLTGYPLPGSVWYAFAQTWYADEMRRPGCVWTHTLLIDTADLATISDMSSLCELFVRPSKDHKHYRRSLSLSTSKQRRIKQSEYSVQIAQSVVSALYEKRDAPAFITAHNCDQYSDLVLELWTQQYAKLRRSFLFSTGSLSNRKLNGKTFDLQIIPPTLARQMRREIPNASFVDETSEDILTVPDWLKVAAEDLLVPADDLRSYLMFFGADATEGRRGFSELVTIFTRIKTATKKISISDVLSVLAEYFPKPEEGLLLKQSLLGGMASRVPFLPTFSESQIFLALATTPFYEPFRSECLKLEHRAANFAQEPVQLRKLLNKLVDKSLNPVGEEIVKGLALGIKPQGLLELASERAGLIRAFSKYNPALLATKQFWQLPADDQREFYDSVTPLIRNGVLDLSAIIGAMLDAGSDIVAQDILRQFGFNAVDAVLNWVDQNERQLPSGWLYPLTYRSDELVRWLRNAQSPALDTLSLLATTLDPHSAQVLGLGSRPWLELIAQLHEPLGSGSIRAWSFLLSLGFQNPDKDAPALVAASFQIVHDWAERDELPYQSWRLLMDQAPSLSWWGDWDKCKRLRHALVDNFVHSDWNPSFFARALKRPETLQEIIKEYGAKSAGGRFLRRVALETRSSASVAPAIRRILSELA